MKRRPSGRLFHVRAFAKQIHIGDTFLTTRCSNVKSKPEDVERSMREYVSRLMPIGQILHPQAGTSDLHMTLLHGCCTHLCNLSWELSTFKSCR